MIEVDKLRFQFEFLQLLYKFFVRLLSTEAAPARRFAMIIAISAPGAFGRACGKLIPAFRADQEAAQRKMSFDLTTHSPSFFYPSSRNNGLDFVKHGLRDQRIMLTRYYLRFFIPVLFYTNKSAINRIMNDPEEMITTGLQTHFTSNAPYCSHCQLPFCDFVKAPPDQRRYWLINLNILSPSFIRFVLVANRRCRHPSTFLSGSSHPVECIQSSAIILYFRSGKVNGKHDLALRDGHIQVLFDSLRFYTELSQDADHLVRIPDIAAETVPFSKENQ